MKSYSVQFALEDWNIKGQVEYKPTADGSFLRASGIGNCLRKQMFNGLKVPYSKYGDVNNMVAREIGNTLHDQVQQALLNYPQYKHVSIETPVELPRYMISGHADAVYTDYNNQVAVVEIKTMRNYGFRQARKNDRPQDNHLMQAVTYALGIEDCEFVHIVYICTDSTPGKWKDGARAGDMCEWLYGLDDVIDESGMTVRQMTEYILNEQYETMTTSLINNNLPVGVTNHATNEDDMEWQCKYCDHQMFCDESYAHQWDVSRVLEIASMDEGDKVESIS